MSQTMSQIVSQKFRNCDQGHNSMEGGAMITKTKGCHKKRFACLCDSGTLIINSLHTTYNTVTKTQNFSGKTHPPEKNRTSSVLSYPHPIQLNKNTPSLFYTKSLLPCNRLFAGSVTK